MELTRLVINPGSASKKYALYVNGREVFRAHFEAEGRGFVVTKMSRRGEEKIKITGREFADSAAKVLGLLKSDGLISKKSDIDAIGFRVVAAGGYFIKTRIIDRQYLKKLTECRETAPLHVSAAVSEIKKFLALFPRARLVGMSDSAFHAAMPERARLYAIPLAASRRFGIYRYGYHGISVQSVLNTARKLLGRLPRRIIVCHLGSGASITAVRNGKCVDTSMGFTPLEGLVMGTRGGDIDAGALVYLSKKLGFSPAELDEFLNKKCGLLGISGKTADVRELLKESEKGDRKAKLALEMFVYRIQKYIGAYFAILGGLDLLVFTAAIGERSSIVRRLICGGLEPLGLKLDEKKNKAMTERNGFISQSKSPVRVAVIKTDEMREIARNM